MNNFPRRPGSITRLSFVVMFLALISTGCGIGMDAQAQLDRGQQAYDQGDFRAAGIDARNVLQEEPENAAARVLLGKAAVAMEDGVSGEKELRRALDLGVDSSQVIVYLARALLQQQKFTAVIEEIDIAAAANEIDRSHLMLSRAEALVGLGEPAAARDIYMEMLSANAENIDALLGVVQTYMTEGSFAQARDSLNEVLANHESNAQAWIVSGSLYYQAGRYELAERDYQTALGLTSGNADRQTEILVWTGLAEVRFAAEDADGAKMAVDQLLALSPDGLTTAYFDARMAYLEQDYSRAQQRLQRVLTASPDYLPAQLLLGAVHLHSGNLSQAEMYLSTVVTAVPSHTAARRLLAETRLQMDKLDEAKVALGPVLQGIDADVASLGLAARASFAGGNSNEAIEYLQRAVQANHDNVEVVLSLAGVLISAGRVEEARSVLSDLPDVAGQNALRRELMGVLLQILEGNVEMALEAANELLSKNPDEVSLLLFVGRVELSAGNYATAREHFSRAKSLAPSNVSTFLNIALVDLAEENPVAARAQYEAALDIDPENVQALVGLARLSFAEGLQDESLELLVRANKADTGAIAPRVILGRIYLAKRDFGAAEDVVRQALQLNESVGELHYMLGMAQRGQGAHAESLRSFRQSLEIEPENPEFRLGLARAHISMNNEESAQEVLEESYERFPRHVETGVLLSALLAKTGDSDRALIIARELQQRIPDSAAPYVLEGELLAESKQYQAAVSAYEMALEKEINRDHAVRAFRLKGMAGMADAAAPLRNYLDNRPADHVVRLILAQFYEGEALVDQADMGDSRAEGLARRAYELASDNANVVDTLATILIDQGDLEEGVTLRRKAALLADDNPDYRYRLASALVMVGEEAEAKRILNEILAQDSEFESRDDAERLLQQQ
jgi:putative PEP-CTERM system TPR-repeat lipoprotein